MKRFWGTARYSSVGVMLAGVGSAITRSNIHALISIDGTDQIGLATDPNGMAAKFSVPTDVPILEPSLDLINDKIADDWADLLAGDIDQSLQEAGVDNVAVVWWSGASSTAAVGAPMCGTGTGGWSSTAGKKEGIMGLTTSMISSWLSGGRAQCDSAAVALICIGY